VTSRAFFLRKVTECDDEWNQFQQQQKQRPAQQAMKAASYLRAQNFAAPSIKQTNYYPINHDENIPCRTNNIMFDNRVCRGNTYSNPVITEDQSRNQRVYEREQSARRRLLERRIQEVRRRRNCVYIIFRSFVRSTLIHNVYSKIAGRGHHLLSGVEFMFLFKLMELWMKYLMKKMWK